MNDLDFAIIADDEIIVGAFLLRQTLSEWYNCALWFSKDLEANAAILKGVPRVFFVGDNPYTHHFRGKVVQGGVVSGVEWGWAGRTATLLSVDLLQDRADPLRELDMTLAAMRRDVRVKRVQKRDSPGLKIAAKFLDPLTAARTSPPAFMSPEDHIRRVQYMIAIATFLQEGFDAWCWGDDVPAGG